MQNSIRDDEDVGYVRSYRRSNQPGKQLPCRDDIIFPGDRVLEEPASDFLNFPPRRKPVHFYVFWPDFQAIRLFIGQHIRGAPHGVVVPAERDSAAQAALASSVVLDHGGTRPAQTQLPRLQAVQVEIWLQRATGLGAVPSECPQFLFPRHWDRFPMHATVDSASNQPGLVRARFRARERLQPDSDIDLTPTGNIPDKRSSWSRSTSF